MVRVGVVDYGVGNIRSVVNALESVGGSVSLVANPEDVEGFDRLILPGVGNFARCAQRLDETGWRDSLIQGVVKGGVPLLGICVGMQLLANTGAESALECPDAKGLGLIPGHVQHLSAFGCNLRLPHVGWNGVYAEEPADGLFSSIPNQTDFYFVHSFAFVPVDRSNIIAVASYGAEFPVAIRRGHVFGVQFHPEKSSRAGLRLLHNFVQGC